MTGSESPDIEKRGNNTPGFDGRQKLILCAILIATAMLTIDVTIVTVALPEIADGIHGDSVTGLQWVLIAYTITFGSLLQISGSLTDIFGIRRMFVGGTLGFILSSLACGGAPSLLILNIARGVQGVAAAVMFSTIMPLVARTFDETLRARAIGVWSGVVGVAGVIAPALGGALVDAAGWRSMFLINIPVGLVALFLIVSFVEQDKPSEKQLTRHSLDIGGALILAAALVSINLGFASVQTNGWLSVVTLSALIIGVMLLPCFAFREHLASTPILELELARNRTFLSISALALLNRVATGGATVYFVLLIQNGYGYTAAQTGSILVPSGIAMLLASLWAGKILKRVSARTILRWGFTCLAVTAVIISWQIADRHDPWMLIPILILWGVGNALANTPIMAVTTSAVPIERVGMATGLVNSFFPIGAGIGTAVLGTVFTSVAGGSDFTLTDLSTANAWIYGLIAVMMVLGTAIALGIPRRQSDADAAR